jgi:hypothetical protein
MCFADLLGVEDCLYLDCGDGVYWNYLTDYWNGSVHWKVFTALVGLFHDPVALPCRVRLALGWDLPTVS